MIRHVTFRYLISMMSSCKLYAFVNNYSSVKAQEGGLNVLLLRTPLFTDPVDKYAEMSRKEHTFTLLHKLYRMGQKTRLFFDGL